MIGKTKAGCLAAILQICISQPIWYYLLYQILVRVQASDLMFFLFWAYVPVGVLIAIVSVVMSIQKD
jgi:hypothetical protein